MAINKRLLVKPPSTGLTPSEHFGVVLYEGDNSSSHSINGGKFGAGAYFNGSSSLITLPSGLSDGATMDASCISFWFNVGAEVTSATSNKELMSFAYSGGATGKISLGSTTGNFTDETFSVTSDVTSQYTYSKTNIPAGWNHAVVQWNSSNTKWDIYVNGVAHTTYTFGTNEQGKFALKFGNRTSFYYEGKLDQIRVFQKVLTSSQVSTLYAETVDTVESLDPLNVDTTDTLQVLGDSSCVATYRFENDETDLSGNYDGTGTAIQYAAGRYGQAASFNGSSSYISGLPTLTNPSGSSFSVSLWVNTNSTDKNIFGGVVDEPAEYDSIFRIRVNSSGQAFTDYRPSQEAVISTVEINGSTSISDGNWHHIVSIVTDSQIKLYVDGSEASNSPKSITGTTNVTNAVIGALNNRGTIQDYLNGSIDQVRVFNKAISAAEVTTLYNENPLVASYRFEGNANDDMRTYDGTATNVTYEYGLGFTPDFVWLKDRTQAYTPNITDSTRGTSKQIFTAYTNAQDTTYTNRVTSFDTGGFTVGNDNYVNTNGNDFVAWCLKANGGTTSTGSGTNTTSVTNQVNSDAGFSITTFTGSASAAGNFTHGLGEVPDMYIVKTTSFSDSWFVWHKDLTNTTGYAVRLNTDAAEQNLTGFWNDTAPTSTLISLGNGVLVNNATYVAYAFKSIDGFSKFGSYTGNGSEQLIETGFEPAFVITKSTSATGHWRMYDNKRGSTDSSSSYDGNRKVLYGDLDIAEGNGINEIRFLSNGFEVGPGNNTNTNGVSFIYMAFATDPDTEAPTVAKSFSTVAYTGNDGTQDIDVGFKPGLVWLKNRNNSSDSTHEHSLFDNLRGAFRVRSNSGSPENDYASHYGGINDNGFQVKNGLALNDADGTYVAWAWKADDNEPTINTEGSIDSLVSANANAGFSIVKYTGNGTNNATVGHGLSAAPEMIIIKNLDGTYAWVVYNSTLGATKYLHLEATDAQQTTSLFFNDTNPSSTVFTLGTHAAVNESGYEMIAYCFHSVAGYSKIGSYSGNGGSNSITGLGFQPDFLLIKDSTSTGSWFMYDSLRTVSVGDNAGTANARPYILANGSGKENGVTSYNVNLDSGGFSMNTSSSELNSSGETYIYMAFKIN
jgi:hypothetical protein